MKKRQNLWLVILTIWLVQLACSDQVKPDDWRLQAPLTTVGMELSKFTDQLKGIPGGVMAPWITSPPDRSFNSERTIVVEGWAPYFRNAQLVLYQVEPNEAVNRAVNIVKSLASTSVDEEYNWQIEVELTDEQQFLAARLELQNGKMSAFSNIVFISLGEPEELVITSPVQDEVVQDDRITLMGTGQPGIGLNLWISGEKSHLTSTVDNDGNWSIHDIPFVVGGFDQENPGLSANVIELHVRSEATGQSASVIVRETEPIELLWPFGTGAGETYDPDINIGTVTAFFANDWHFRHLNNDHQAWDISTSSGCVRGAQIHAVSGGEVVVVGTSSSYGGYIIIDSGDFGVLYLHVMEIAVNRNDEVIPGQIIAYEGYVNSPDGNCDTSQGAIKVHLHIEVAVWAQNVNKTRFSTFQSQQKVNLNPPEAERSQFVNINSNLYQFWGPDNYCGQNGCWRDMDWSVLSIKPVGDIFKKTYEELCLSEFNQITNTNLFSGRSARYQWCLENPDKCAICK